MNTRDCYICGGDGYVSEPVRDTRSTGTTTRCPGCDGTGRVHTRPRLKPTNEGDRMNTPANNDHLLGFNATIPATQTGADDFFGIITCTYEVDGVAKIAVTSMDGTEERQVALNDATVSG